MAKSKQRVAYEAYATSVAEAGGAMQPWEHVSELDRKHWEAVADALEEKIEEKEEVVEKEAVK